MIKQIIKWIKEVVADPVSGCELYKNEGCSFVGGLLCDYPKCKMLKVYRKNGNTNKERDKIEVYQSSKSSQNHRRAF